MSKRQPPVESPNWTAYSTALREATERFGSERLAIDKLDAALASRTIHCKIERIGAAPELVKLSDQVQAFFLPTELQEQGDERPAIGLNRMPREGWLFMWNFDLIKYFGGTVKTTPPAPAETQKSPSAIGRPPIHNWPEIEKIAVRLHLKFPALNRNQLIAKVQDELETKGKKVPVLSQMQLLVNRIFGVT